MPAGGAIGPAIGNTVAQSFGWDPKTPMDEDLVRMKALLEPGWTRAPGQAVSLGELRAPPPR